MPEDAGRPQFWTAKGFGPANNTPGGGNLPVKNGRVRGAAWADSSNGIPLHGFTRNGLRGSRAMSINCTNNNEAFSFHPGVCNIVFADGHVKSVSDGMSIKVYAALITRAGDEVLPPVLNFKRFWNARNDSAEQSHSCRLRTVLLADPKECVGNAAFRRCCIAARLTHAWTVTTYCGVLS